VQAPDRCGVIASQIVRLVLLAQVRRIERLEAYEQASKSSLDSVLDHPRLQDGLDGCCRLPKPAHAAHAIEERGREARVAKKVVVEKVEVASRQAIDLGKGVIDLLGIEMPALPEEGPDIAKIAPVGTATRDNDRVGYKVEVTLEEVAAYARHAGKRPHLRPVRAFGLPAPEIPEESRPGVLTRPEKDGIGVARRLLRQRCHVQSPEAHMCPAHAVQVRDLIGAPG